ncbi:D-Ala-D-Ala carboxypeptidase family metallohydrolase [Spirosoma areae]
MNNPVFVQPTVPFANFGPWLTYSEAVKSATAIRLGIVNVPTPAQYANMVRAYNGLYVPICKQFGKLPVTSFFRSAKLNAAVKGSKTSAHLDGLAIDIDCDGLSHVSNFQLYKFCRKNRKALNYDQLILEGYDSTTGQAAWVHIAFRQVEPQRQQCLIMVRKNGKTTYAIDPETA